MKLPLTITDHSLDLTKLYNYMKHEQLPADPLTGQKIHSNPRITSAGPKLGPALKRCAHCEQDLPLDSFPYSKPPFRLGICNECLVIHNAKLAERGVKPQHVATLVQAFGLLAEKSVNYFLHCTELGKPVNINVVFPHDGDSPNVKDDLSPDAEDDLEPDDEENPDEVDIEDIKDRIKEDEEEGYDEELGTFDNHDEQGRFVAASDGKVIHQAIADAVPVGTEIHPSVGDKLLVAYDTLQAAGWSRKSGLTYTHKDKPGHSIRVCPIGSNQVNIEHRVHGDLVKHGKVVKLNE
jgi:hypothetical protein